nr:IclR family transcriptional regulator C-terminal domain-containing protein [Mameliella sediminis]
MAVRLGAQIDLWRASSGRVILAYQPKEEVRRLMKEVPIPKDSSAEQILEELAQIRAGGLEVRDSFVVRGVVNISVPIIDHSGQAVAALTIPHIERYGEPISFETCKSELAATAALLSKTLGGQPPEVS